MCWNKKMESFVTPDCFSVHILKSVLYFCFQLWCSHGESLLSKLCWIESCCCTGLVESVVKLDLQLDSSGRRSRSATLTFTMASLDDSILVLYSPGVSNWLLSLKHQDFVISEKRMSEWERVWPIVCLVLCKTSADWSRIWLFFCIVQGVLRHLTDWSWAPF